MSKPICIGMIGLSASAKTGWASGAHLPYLQTARGRSKYKITALCNSSVAAAENAIKAYGLDPGTKAYGNPDDLAKDDQVDLVVCNARVDLHYETVLPSVQAGKSAYIEWPVTSSVADTGKLAEAAKKSGAEIMVGLQGRWAPPVLKVKELLESGVVGKVLSSDVRAFGGTIDREILPIGLKYFSQREVGGNPITIGFGHVFDWVQAVLGEVAPDTLHAHTQLQRPEVRIKDAARGDAIVERVQSDVPDLLSVHGALVGSGTVTQGASLTAYYRRGQPSFGDAALTWSLTCEHGEIRLVAPEGIGLQADAYGKPVTVQVQRYDQGDAVEEVAWDWSAAQTEIPVRGRTVQSVYEAFAAGDADGVVSLESALTRARQIEQLLASFDGCIGRVTFLQQ